jgi:hypothetical protein
MNKLSVLGLALSASIMTGCMATSEGSVDLTTVDFNTLTCEEIGTVFKDYKENVDSGDNYTSMLGALSSDAAAAAKTAKTTAMTAYYSAKKVAEPAIKVKGCNI